MNEGLKDKINHLKNEIDTLRPLDKDTEGRIQQKFRLDWNFHSNNIEGNSLTFGETKSFLLHGITAAGKPLKDHLDIKGHNQALEMLEDIVHDGRDLSENFIREMHQIILHEPYEKTAKTPDGKKVKRHIQVGSYKTQPNHVITETEETFYFAKPEETPALMNDLMAWFNNAISERKLHPIELAALLHYKFMRIHPFDDGNGRLSRILMNLSLMKFGFPPVIIKTQKKEEYIRALRQADGGDPSFFVDYIAKLQIESLELYLRGAKGEHIEEENDVDKEISLFKASLNIQSTKNLRSTKSQARVFDETICILIERLSKKLNSFNELFYFHNFSISSTSSSYSDKSYLMFQSIESALQYLKSKAKNNSSLQDIRFTFYWRNFIHNNVYPYPLEATVNFSFYDYSYSISANNISIETSYSQNITEEDIQKIIVELTKSTLVTIKEKYSNS